jgi:uncharacterized protein YheU (UPF0270 family)
LIADLWRFIYVRDVTITGYTKNTLEQNVGMVMWQLRRGNVVVVYDERTKTANLIPKGELKDRIINNTTAKGGVCHGDTD